MVSLAEGFGFQRPAHPHRLPETGELLDRGDLRHRQRHQVGPEADEQAERAARSHRVCLATAKWPAGSAARRTPGERVTEHRNSRLHRSRLPVPLPSPLPLDQPCGTGTHQEYFPLAHALSLVVIVPRTCGVSRAAAQAPWNAARSGCTCTGGRPGHWRSGRPGR